MFDIGGHDDAGIRDKNLAAVELNSVKITKFCGYLICDHRPGIYSQVQTATSSKRCPAFAANSGFMMGWSALQDQRYISSES